MQTALLWTAAVLFVGPQVELAQAGGEYVPPAPSPIVLEHAKVMVIHQAEVPSRVPGVLAYREVNEGDEVTTGQELARLDDRHANLQLDVSTIEAANDVNVRYSVKAAEVAEAEFHTAKKTNARVASAIPQLELERLRLVAERGRLQIEQAQRDQELARLKQKIDAATLDDHRITSPIDGVVLQVYKNKGEAVSAGETVFKVVGIDQLRVEGFLPMRDTWQVRRGHLVQFQLDVPDAVLPVENVVFEGKVVFVDQFLDPVTGEYRVWAEIANRDHLLRPGMEGTLTVLPQLADPATAERPDPTAR